MPETLLQTKLYIPPLRPNLVSRPRLVEQLNQGLEQGARLTVISTPAGFGKTTLLSLWAQECGLPVAWISLSSEDNDLTLFMDYLANALRAIATDIGQASLIMMNSSAPSPLKQALIVLINELARIPNDFILFLDDYHFIDDEEIHTALSYLVDNIPPQYTSSCPAGQIHHFLSAGCVFVVNSRSCARLIFGSHPWRQPPS